MIGQMVTEIASEAKAGHFAGLVPVPLLDGRSSHRNGTTGDPNERPHPVVNSGQTRACMQHACEYSRSDANRSWNCGASPPWTKKLLGRSHPLSMPGVLCSVLIDILSATEDEAVGCFPQPC